MIATVILGLTACSGQTGTADSEKHEITLWATYANGGNQALQDAVEKVVLPAFENAHPNITVDYVDIPYASLLQKLQTGAAAGDLPCLVRSDEGWMAQMADLGVFAALDEEMDDFDDVSAQVYPATLGTDWYNGHYYGMPVDTSTRVLMTNPEVLASVGVTEPPATFAEFTDLAVKLKDKGIYVFADAGLQGWNVFPWIWSAGGEVLNADNTKATGYLDSPKSVAGVQLLVDLYQDGSIPNLITGNTGATGVTDGVPKGMYASVLEGPWMYSIWGGQYPDFAFTASLMPAGDGGSISVAGVNNMAMTSSCEDKDAAEEFIRFTLSEDFQVEMAKNGLMSVVPGLENQMIAVNPDYAPFIEQLATAKSRPSVPQTTQINEAIQNHLLRAFNGEVTTQQALTAAAEEIDGLLGKG